MTGSTEGLPKIGERIDESSLTPSEKAHRSPLQREELDHVGFDLHASKKRLSVTAGAKVRGGPRSASNFAVITAMAILSGATAALLLRWFDSPGAVALTVCIGIFIVVLAAGVVVTSTHTCKSDSPSRSA